MCEHNLNHSIKGFDQILMTVSASLRRVPCENKESVLESTKIPNIKGMNKSKEIDGCLYCKQTSWGPLTECPGDKTISDAHPRGILQALRRK